MTLVTLKTDNEDESSSDSDDDNTNNAQQTQNEHKVQWVEVDSENISVKNIPFSGKNIPFCGIPPQNNSHFRNRLNIFVI